MRMYWLRSAWLAMKGQLRYRMTFIVSGLAQFLSALSAFAGIIMLFARFKTLRGYSLPEALLMFGVTLTGFALAEIVGRGFDRFDALLADGSFDRILLRPRNEIVQVLSARFELSRLGRVFVGAAALAWSLPRVGVEWNFPRVLTLGFMIGGAAAIFTGVFILGAAFSFLTTDALEFINILSDGGRELGQYPLTIYGKWIRRFFTFIVPFACVNYLPLLFLLGRPGAGPWVCALPLVGFLFMIPALLVWKAGVRRYRSTGS
jgi:ABC-2 type transport system permease protein